jgi:hypothetical protein
MKSTAWAVTRFRSTPWTTCSARAASKHASRLKTPRNTPEEPRPTLSPGLFFVLFGER